ncbi:hypothetical protein [Stenotrophomonas sp. BIGb0135]|uniref:hypothetical protein n=1 Tax=Stenotrophomonas sp. BIGb0135 TaxID=2940620 RepID=UPI002168DF0F|nr:hypothetical protein [Stenotrophomonas sp. BIGb0135]MCS4234451.1 hypothetical protein [Stenotrophomonas sp. BIGb0135]
MSRHVDVLAVLRSQLAWIGPCRPDGDEIDCERWDRIESAIAAVAELIEALEGLDEAYCRAGPQLTRDERMEDRKRLIAARAALTLVKGGAA